MARKRVVQIVEGEWTVIAWRGQRESCCHCHLTHDVDYRVRDGKLQFRAKVNNRATAAARRAFALAEDDA